MTHTPDAPHHIGVVGAGQMGAGIAQVALQSGLAVTLVDTNDAILDKARTRIDHGLGILVRKNKLDEKGRAAALDRLTVTATLHPLAKLPLVIEAIVEKEAAKHAVFASLDDVCDAGTIFASNTSSISITRLGGRTRRPDKFIGMHFFNPVPVMALVEIIRSPATAERTAATAHALAARMGKTTVDVADAPGFIVNRIMMPMLNEAAYAVMEGVGSPDDIDKAMLLGMNLPIGPLSLADFIGLDVCLDVMRVVHADLGDPKYRPCPLIMKYVDAGWLGRKTGRGFFRYNDKGEKIL